MDSKSLKLNNNQIDDYESLKERKRIASVSNINNDLDYIHPECVSVNNLIQNTNCYSVTYCKTLFLNSVYPMDMSTM